MTTRRVFLMWEVLGNKPLREPAESWEGYRTP